MKDEVITNIDGTIDVVISEIATATYINASYKMLIILKLKSGEAIVFESIWYYSHDMAKMKAPFEEKVNEVKTKLRDYIRRNNAENQASN